MSQARVRLVLKGLTVAYWRPPWTIVMMHVPSVYKNSFSSPFRMLAAVVGPPQAIVSPASGTKIVLGDNYTVPNAVFNATLPFTTTVRLCAGPHARSPSTLSVFGVLAGHSRLLVYRRMSGAGRATDYHTRCFTIIVDERLGMIFVFPIE